MIDTPRDRPVLRVGDAFSPKLKFFASMIPDGLMRLRSLKEGPKLLLARLHKYAGDSDRCNPSLATLAAELGTSHDTIGRWMGDLERSGLIRTVRHQRREADRLMLLAPELVSSLRPPWTVSENAELRNQEPILNTQNCVLEYAESGFLNTQNGPPYKEKRIKEEDQGSESNIHVHRKVDKGFDVGPDAGEQNPLSTKVDAKGQNHSPPLRGGRVCDSPPTLKKGKPARDHFPEFWSLYWRKDGKTEAREVFAKKVTTEAEWDVVKAAVITQTPKMMAREKQFRPMAKKWLAGECYLDEESPLATRPLVVDKNQQRRDEVNQGLKALDRLRRK